MIVVMAMLLIFQHLFFTKLHADTDKKGVQTHKSTIVDTMAEYTNDQKTTIHHSSNKMVASNTNQQYRLQQWINPTTYSQF